MRDESPGDPNTDPADLNQADKDSAQRKNKNKHTKKRQKQDDSAGKRKKQKQLKKKTAVTDWTSDDSSDGGPAAIPDHLNPMPDSDAEEEAATADSPRVAAAEVGQSVDAPSNSHGKSDKQRKKKRLYQAGSKEKAKSNSNSKAAADWSSGGGIDAGPVPMSDNLNPMPDSGSDGEGSASKAAGTGKQARRDSVHDQQQAKRAKHAAQPDGSSAKHDTVFPAVNKKFSNKKQQKRVSAKAQAADELSSLQQGTGQRPHEDAPKADSGTEHCTLIWCCSADA